jgi:hypothetical protein
MTNETEPEPVELGDGRQKHIAILSSTGDRITHDNSYLRHSTTEFIVSPDDSFSPAKTTRYTKSEISRIEISQHHSRCFITTAVADEQAALQVLRDFRDDALTASLPGQALIRVYETLSPPIAETLARHPHAQTTQAVRWLVHRCAQLARQRTTTSSPVGRCSLSILLTMLYLVGVIIALLGHFAIQLRTRRKPATPENQLRTRS